MKRFASKPDSPSGSKVIDPSLEYAWRQKANVATKSPSGTPFLTHVKTLVHVDRGLTAHIHHIVDRTGKKGFCYTVRGHGLLVNGVVHYGTSRRLFNTIKADAIQTVAAENVLREDNIEERRDKRINPYKISDYTKKLNTPAFRLEHNDGIAPAPEKPIERARDTITITQDFYVYVQHLYTVAGSGFRARICSRNMKSVISSPKIHIGDSQVHWEMAKIDAFRLMRRETKKLRDRVRQRNLVDLANPLLARERKYSKKKK